MSQNGQFPHHFERSVTLPESASVVFEHLDDFERLGAHMMRSSWMMAGFRMRYEFDAAKGRALNGLVRLRGSMLGMPLAIDEKVIERTPAVAKTWQTIGKPRMLVIAHYRMGYRLVAHDRGCRLTVFIDYALAPHGVGHWLGRMAGGPYARWCVTSMVDDAIRSFGRVDDLASAQTH